MIGPLELSLEVDIFRSSIHIHAYEGGMVRVGTSHWYESKYMIFRCIYGLMRLNGLRNLAWESTNVFDERDFVLYQEHFGIYEPHLRVQLPETLDDPYIIENMWSYSYMKLYPQLVQHQPPPMYPSGDTTIRVDSYLNMDPEFCPNLL